MLIYYTNTPMPSIHPIEGLTEDYVPTPIQYSHKDRPRDPTASKKPERITCLSFRDPRGYVDPDLTEPEWQLQSGEYRKRYRQWLRSERQKPNNYMFKRAFKQVEVTKTDDEGNSYTELKTVPISWVAKRATPNHAKVTISASKTGVDVDDNEYVPKMFTSAMGTDIMLRRNELDLTQENVAHMINVDVNTIRAIELGGKVAFNPQDSLVHKLSTVLKTGIRYIE